MPRVNPQILAWARETAGLSQVEAASKLGFSDGKRASAVSKLAALETGEAEPTRPQLVKMAQQYRRPLLTFYLSQPPAKGDRGVDFRSLAGDRAPASEADLDALVRNVRARQSMVRAILEEMEEDVPIPFVGSCSMSQGKTTVLQSLVSSLDLDLATYRKHRNAADAFNWLRMGVESKGVFVLIKGDLGNYRTAIDTEVFRGFSIADDIAPFVIINDQDARPAWSFTLLHEMVHLLLGQSGVGSTRADSDIERFCDDVAGEFLLPTHEVESLDFGDSTDLADVSDRVAEFANQRNLSRTMVAYRAYRCDRIGREVYGRLSAAFHQQWRADRERDRRINRGREGGPSFYVVRRHRLGDRLTGLVRRALSSDELTTSKAARVLDLKPGQVPSVIGTPNR